MGLLSAGVGRTSITPPVGISMMGYASRDRGSSSIHDDLVATALVLHDGATQLAVVTCDLVFIHPQTVAEVRARIAAQAGIPGPNVMVCCSHTHSGPVTWHLGTTPVMRERRARYVEDLADRIVTAIAQAAERMRPAAWGMGSGEVAIGMNRRQRRENGGIALGANPEGVIDPGLWVLRVDEVAGDGQSIRPLAALVNYACHAVCLSSNNYALSADWPGAMRRSLEGSTGAVVGFVQGACADINPIGGPQDTFESAERLGTRVAEEAERAYATADLCRQARLRVGRRVFELPLREAGDGKTEGLAAAAQVTGIPVERVAEWLDSRFPWSADVFGKDEPVGGPRFARMEGQVFAWGDVALVAIAAEPFVEIGLEVKSRAHPTRVMFAGYTNGSLGYLATPQAHQEGGYEVDSSYVYYRLPTPLAPACAQQVRDGLLSMLTE